MEVSVVEAISRMLRAVVQEKSSTLYVQVGARTEVILRGEAGEKRILQGPPKVFEQLRHWLLDMAAMPPQDAAVTREGEICTLVEGQMHLFRFRETRSLLDPGAFLLTVRYQARD